MAPRHHRLAVALVLTSALVFAAPCTPAPTPEIVEETPESWAEDELDIAAWTASEGVRTWNAFSFPRQTIKTTLGDVKKTKDGTAYRWVNEEQFDLYVDVLDTSVPLTVRLVASANGKPGMPDRTLKLNLNKKVLGKKRLPKKFKELAWEIPAETLRQGTNKLTFRSTPFVPKKAPEKPQDVELTTEELSAHTFRVSSASVGPTREIDEDASVLRLSSGSEVRIPFIDRGGILLDTGRIELADPDGPTCSLSVAVHLDGRELDGPNYQVLATIEPGHSAVDLALSTTAGASGFLVLTAIGEADATLRIPAPIVTLRHPERELESETTPLPVMSKRPDVVIYLADTVRADRISALGYELPTTPTLERLLTEGATIHRAYSNAPWTRPSVATVLTGLEQDAHGVRTQADSLPEDVPLPPEALQAEGYTTVAYVTNPHVQKSTGFDRGFDTFVEAAGPDKRLLGPTGKKKDTVKKKDLLMLHEPVKRRVEYFLPDAIREIGHIPAEEPLFLYLHSMAAHAPYYPPETSMEALGLAGAALPPLGGEPLERSSEQLDYIVSVLHNGLPLDLSIAKGLSTLYDAEIHSEDAYLATLIDALVEQGRWDEALFLYVSDHGEQFGEHGGLAHGADLYEELLRVPVLIKLPKSWEAELTGEVSLLDLTPTILDITVTDRFPPTSQVRSLVRGGEGAEYYYAEATARRVETVRDERFKLITGEGRMTWDLYDLQLDPDEQLDVSHFYPGRVAAMIDLIEAREQDNLEILTTLTRSGAQHSDSQRAELKALGYVE